MLQRLAICHLLIALAALLALAGARSAAGLAFLAVGLGGVGAGWGRWTEDDGGWLDILAAFRHWPRRSVATCLLEHAPFIPLGVWLLLRP